MNAVSEWFRRIWYLVNRRRLDEELRQEMQAHRELMANPARFGNSLRLRDEARDVWRWGWLDDGVRDLRFAARTLLRTPSFTLAVVSSLALALVLTAVTLAVVNAYLIRSMPYPAADRLYRVIYGQPEPRGMTALDWESLTDIVEIADYSTPSRVYVVDDGPPKEAVGLLVAPGSLEAVGVRVAHGRSLLPDDFRQGAEQVALIGQSLWRDRFGSDPNVVGRTFRASQAVRQAPTETYRVVGVLPPGFRYVREYARADADFVAPLRTVMRTYMIRIRPGVPAAFAEQRVDQAARQVATAVPQGWSGIRLESIERSYVQSIRPVLVALMVAVVIVLIISCSNVAVLTLLRAMRRQKEVAVRLALGAGRRHIVRMLAAEMALICTAAMGIGLGVAALTLGALAPSIEERLGRDVPGGTPAMTIDATVLLIMAAIGVLVALSLSFIPLLGPWQRRVADWLRPDSRAGMDRPSTRYVRASLIAFEVAASLALLVGAGLMIRTVINVVRTDFGLNTHHVLRARITIPATYADAESFVQFHDRLAMRLAALTTSPFAVSSSVPFFETPKRTVEVAAGTRLDVGVLTVSPAYFATLGIGVREGRALEETDRLESEPVAVVSQTLARRLWPVGGAIGSRLRAAQDSVPASPPGTWRTVVGVVGDVRQTAADRDLNEIYIPFAQAPSRYAQLFVRTDQSVPYWRESLRTAVAAVDPKALAAEPTSLDSEVARQVQGPKFLMSLLTGFAVFASLLALVGTYGVAAYAVQQREREIAIRLAIGATAQQIVRMFLKHAATVLLPGVVCGLLGAVVVARLLESQLHGVDGFDAATVVVTGTALAGAALVATWWPARRAAGRNPMASLTNS
jgi:putative ABC transport system permease protein